MGRMIFPKLTGERVIILSMLMVLAAESIKAIAPIETAFWFKTAVTGLELGELLLIVTLIITGTRRLRCKKTSVSGIAMTLIGLCICLVPFYGFYVYNKLGTTFDYKSSRLQAMKKQLDGGNMPLKDRAKLSQMYAQNKFLEDGVTVEILADDGSRRPYAPTKEDRDLLKLRNDAKLAWTANYNSIVESLWLWGAVAGICILLGLFTPIKITKPVDVE